MIRQVLTRVQAVLLALMIVATPLALLAHPSFRAQSKCSGMCCRPQKSYSTPVQPASSASFEEGMLCHRGTAGHMAMCIKPSNPPDDRDVVAPLPPATLLEQDSVDELQLRDEKLGKHSSLARTGFAPIPFEPPRS
jgi:hypothetical protein